MSATLESVVDRLKQAAEDHEFVDVGKGTEKILRCSHAKLQAARRVLGDSADYEIYTLDYIHRESNTLTKIKVLTRKGNTWTDARSAVANGYLHHLKEKQ